MSTEENKKYNTWEDAATEVIRQVEKAIEPDHQILECELVRDIQIVNITIDVPDASA